MKGNITVIAHYGHDKDVEIKLPYTEAAVALLEALAKMGEVTHTQEYSKDTPKDSSTEKKSKKSKPATQLFKPHPDTFTKVDYVTPAGDKIHKTVNSLPYFKGGTRVFTLSPDTTFALEDDNVFETEGEVLARLELDESAGFGKFLAVKLVPVDMG